MNNKKRRYRIDSKKKRLKIIITASSLITLVLFAFVFISLNTADYKVYDGTDTYNISVTFPSNESIINKAEKSGMRELSSLDDFVHDEDKDTLTVYRAVELNLNIEGEQSSIHANVGQTVGEALQESGINSDGLYKVLPSESTVIEKNTEVRLNKGYIVNLNGKEMEVEGEAVADALKAFGIEYNGDDSIEPSPDKALYPGINVSYKEGHTIKITNGSFSAETSTLSSTVGEFLEERNLSLDSDDRISHRFSEPISDGMEIVIKRIYSVNESVREDVPYDTDYEVSFTLLRGGSKVLTPGEAGSDEVTYCCVYENGKLLYKKELSRTTITKPVTEIVLRGPKEDYQKEVEAAVVGNSGSGNNYFIDHNGNKVYYKSQLYGEATAYCIPNGITSIGLPVGRGVVAVDPKVIPYGSKLYITSGGYCYGYAVAGDTGGAMLSGRVLTDLYMDSIDECFEFGRRNMTVYVIE